MFAKTTSLIALTALAAAASTARAGEIFAEQIFVDDAGNALPADKTVLRFYWQADDPADQLVGIVGSPACPLQMDVVGGTFFDSDHFVAGDRPPSFGFLGLPGFEELSYDSWFTIGNTQLDVGPAWPSGAGFSDQVITAPGTSLDGADGATTWNGGPGGPDNVAWTVPPSQDDPGGGGVQNTPQSVAGNWPGNQVVFLQLAIDGGPMSVSGSLSTLVVEDGTSAQVCESFVFKFPAPGTLALLVLAPRRA